MKIQIRFSLLLSGLLACPALWAGPLNVKIIGLKNDNGTVRCGLFNQADGWRDEARAVKNVVATAKNNTAVCDFGVVDPGTYALAVFHAEANEHTVSYGFLGKPHQGVGFSNNPSIKFGAPKFSEAEFKISEAPNSQSITIQY